jgi:hypothetical protein
LTVVPLTSAPVEELISKPKVIPPVSISITALQRLGLEVNGLIRAVRSRVDATKEGVISAGAYPNPKLEFVGGHNRARAPGQYLVIVMGHMSANELKIHFYVSSVLVQLKQVLKPARQGWIGHELI